MKLSTMLMYDGNPRTAADQVVELEKAGLDTVWVAPGQRYDTIATARAGLWAFHCHILSHAENEKGMFGMVTAVVVK